MTISAILLIVLSSFTHAGWNLLGKNNQATPAAYTVANLAGVVLLLPALLVFLPAVLRMPAGVWEHLAVTGAFQALYYVSLSTAYRGGDMSVAYPLARALPIVFVTILTYLLGHGRAISSIGLVGFALVIAGALLLPLARFRRISLRTYTRPNLLFAVLAAVGTTGYSMVDSSALRLFRSALTAGGVAAHWRAPLVYSFFEAVSSFAWLALFLLFRPAGRSQLREAWSRERFVGALLMGIGIYLTYTLVLVSMGFVTNVGYVVAFRQLSIPLGVIASITLLNEPPHPPKLVAIVVLLAGLALTAIG